MRDTEGTTEIFLLSIWSTLHPILYGFICVPDTGSYGRGELKVKPLRQEGNSIQRTVDCDIRLPASQDSSHFLTTPRSSHRKDTRPMDDRIPSVSPSSLTISKHKVATVFHLPLSALATPAHLRSDVFWATTSSYWAVDVSNMVEH